jgi:hypothetical protein
MMPKRPRYGAATSREELGMRKNTGGPREWAKPEIKRLGQIRDVAGAQTPLTQAANTKS